MLPKRILKSWKRFDWVKFVKNTAIRSVSVDGVD